MREAISGLLAAEAEAKKLVDAAKLEADRIMREAKALAQTQAGEIRQQARAEAEALLVAAEKSAEQKKSERLANFAAQLEVELPLSLGELNAAVAGVVDIVSGRVDAGKGEFR